jgi:Arc/MetJ family transcription regulator
VSKTLIDIDDDLLAEAANALGTTTKKDTVAKALQCTVEDARAKRTSALWRLQELVDEGGFDFEGLGEQEK